jgi:hypothetical protein
MKKNFFKGAVLALFAMLGTSAMAQTVSITDVTVEPGNTAAATLSFDGTDVVGFQFYVSGDQVDGTNIVLESVEAVEEAFPVGADLGLSKFNTKKNRYTVTVSDKEAEVLVPGEFMKMNFAAAADLAEGEYNLNLNVAEISIKGSDPIEQGDVAFKVTVGATGIEAIELIENNAPVYNLAGMLMNGNLQKGIYVQNGKKYIVK